VGGGKEREETEEVNRFHNCLLSVSSFFYSKTCGKIFDRENWLLIRQAIVGYFTYKTIVQPTIFSKLWRERFG
jgi:hypothetical protein